jgi:hypothetical protein
MIYPGGLSLQVIPTRHLHGVKSDVYITSQINNYFEQLFRILCLKVWPLVCPELVVSLGQSKEVKAGKTLSISCLISRGSG